MSINQNAGSTSPAEPPPVVVAPPLTNEQLFEVERTARLLDPDLYAAVQQGNQTIIQAIAMGATTTDQVVNNLVRMGVTPTMCPPGVGQLVAERQKELEIKREEEERFQKNMVAGLGTMAFGAGMMGMMPRVADAQTAEQRTSSTQPSGNPDRDMWINVSAAEFAVMSYERWSQLTENQKQGAIDITRERAQELMNKSGHIADGVRDKLNADSKARGLTDEQALERERGIMRAVWIGDNNRDLDLKTEAGREAARANIARLPEEDRRYAEELLRPYTDLDHGSTARNQADKAKQTGPEDDATRLGQVQAANTNIVAGTHAISSAPTDAARAEAAARSDEARDEGRQAARTDKEHADLRATDAANLAARQQVDGVAAQANFKVSQARPTDEYEVDAAATKTATAPRLTIAIPPDKVGVESALLNRLGAAANDPAKAPEPEENRRLSGPATGMGSSA